MVVDRRLALVALAVGAFGSGWGTHALLARAPEPVIDPQGRAPGHDDSRPERVAPQPSAQPSASASASMEAVFDDIYQRATWGKNASDAGGSGYGSTLRATLLYRTFLQQFMKDAEVRSVVDAGCGDWEFSQALDWTGIDYKGFDIVKSVIEGDKKSYAKPNIQFFAANVVETDLPAADLLISKHVLQHLPTAEVQKFLTKQLPKYKHVLLVSSVSPGTLSGKNQDIPTGGFRDLDVTRPPFSVRGAKVLTYWDGGNMQQIVYVARQP